MPRWYFDVNTGASRFTVRLGDMVLAEWTADDWFPTRRLDGSSSNPRVIPNVSLRRDDVIHVVGVPEGGETAALDYVELTKR